MILIPDASLLYQGAMLNLLTGQEVWLQYTFIHSKEWTSTDW